MQGVRCRLPAASVGEPKRSATSALTIDGAEEAPGKRVERLIQENPVVVFSRRGCCMCHVMRRLLGSVGVHPTVIELDDGEEAAAGMAAAALPAVFIGGAAVEGLEGLMELHLSGRLAPKLREVGALWG